MEKTNGLVKCGFLDEKSMTTTNILKLANELLKMHDGSCSVPSNSRYGDAFRLMEQAGKVRVQNSTTAGMIDVYSADFVIRIAPEKE